MVGLGAASPASLRVARHGSHGGDACMGRPRAQGRGRWPTHRWELKLVTQIAELCLCARHSGKYRWAALGLAERVTFPGTVPSRQGIPCGGPFPPPSLHAARERAP